MAPRPPVEHAPDDRPVFPRDRPRGKLARKYGMRQIRFRDHHQTGGVFVQAVHDSGTRRIAARCQRTTMMEQCVDKCPGVVAMGGMCHHAGRFVHHEKVRVFVDDVEGDLFGDGVLRGGLGQGDVDDLPPVTA